MTITAERRRVLDIYEKYGSLLCERCEIGTVGHHPLSDIWPYCPECIDETCGPYPPWYVVTDNGWEEWTIKDKNDTWGESPFPWEIWVEESRYVAQRPRGTLIAPRDKSDD